MKAFLLIAAGIITSLQAISQKEIKISAYTVPKENGATKVVVLTMSYNNYNIVSIQGDTTGLGNAGDILIDIVCTDYPPSANLKALNDNRLKAVMQLFPFIHQTQIQKINLLRQTNGSNKPTAQAMFHGVVIQYRPAQTMETMKHDIKKLDEILTPEYDTVAIAIKPKTDTIKKVLPPKKMNTDYLPVPIADSTEPVVKAMKHGSLSLKDFPKKRRYRPGIIAAETAIEFRKGDPDWPDSVIDMSPKEALEKKYITKREYREFKWSDVITFSAPRTETDEFPKGEMPLIKDSSSPTGYILNPKYHIPDSTVFKILKRNKWKGITVVGDVTGSMYPYTGQLLLWLKLNSIESLTNNFAFFNDGDDKPDRKKIIGKTGGVYSQKCDSFNEVRDLVKSTMMRGSGGDCPENDIEALLHAQQAFPQTICFVLIADNWAPIKDKSLISQLNKPVRVVLCGTDENNINPDYLNLARQTNGSVHLMESDLYNLAQLNEGATLIIGKRTFKIVDGQFVDISEMTNGKL